MRQRLADFHCSTLSTVLLLLNLTTYTLFGKKSECSFLMESFKRLVVIAAISPCLRIMIFQLCDSCFAHKWKTLRSRLLFSVTTFVTAQNASSGAALNAYKSYAFAWSLLPSFGFKCITSINLSSSIGKLVVQVVLIERFPLRSFCLPFFSTWLSRMITGAKNPYGSKTLDTMDRHLTWVHWFSGSNFNPLHAFNVSLLFFYSQQRIVEAFSSAQFVAHIVNWNPPLARSVANSTLMSAASWLLCCETSISSL